MSGQVPARYVSANLGWRGSAGRGAARRGKSWLAWVKHHYFFEELKYGNED